MKFTAKGRVQLFRDSVLISSHVVDEEAYESAFTHAVANGPGKYVVKYPDREIDLSTLTRVVFDIDATPPSAPSGVSATAQSQTTIRVAWSASTDTGGSGLAGYRVYRSTTSTGTFTQVGSDLSVASLSFDDATLTASTTRYYRVVAFDGNGNVSAQSSTVSATTSAAPSAGDWQLAAGHFETAKIPLDIIAPVAGLSTTNRYYKAYPGIPLRLPVVALGGAWPFKYELLQGPSGMTIGETLDRSAFATSGLGGANADYGVITWSNPTTSGSPHTIRVRVTDQEGNTDTVTWTLTVTTSGFLFIDSVNGSDANAGTLASPKRTISGWYTATKANSAYDGYFIYYREGTYFTADAPQEDGWRMAVSSTKPVVHLGYPGELVSIDVTNNAWNQYSAGGHGFYGNLRWINIRGNSDDKALVINSGESNSVVFENAFANPVEAGSSGNNASLIFLQAGGAGSNFGIVRNTFEGTNSHDMALLYSGTKGVIEGNLCTNVVGALGHGFYFKIGPSTWSVRANRGPSGNTDKFVRFDSYTPTPTDVELCWNYWRSSGNGWYFGDESGNFGQFWSYRNTWVVGWNEVDDSGGTGTMQITRDVTQHNGSFSNGIEFESGADLTITQTGHLTGTSGIVDANGLLTGSDRTNYFGIRGFEVA